MKNTFNYELAIGMAALVAYFLALCLWLGALNVLLLDLERRELPARNTRWLRAARVLAPMAIVISALVVIAFETSTDWLLPGLYALIFLAVGAVLLVHKIEARHARLVHGMLPWLGMAAGVAYLIVGLSYAAWHFTPEVAANVLIGQYLGIIVVANTPVLIDVNPRYFGELLYIIWAIWPGCCPDESGRSHPPV